MPRKLAERGGGTDKAVRGQRRRTRRRRRRTETLVKVKCIVRLKLT